MLRGGSGGGARATARKRNEQAQQAELLSSLVGVLQALASAGKQQPLGPKRKKKKLKRAKVVERKQDEMSVAHGFELLVKEVRQKPQQMVGLMERFLSAVKQKVGSTKSPEKDKAPTWAAVVGKASPLGGRKPKDQKSVTLNTKCWSPGMVRDVGGVPARKALAEVWGVSPLVASSKHSVERSWRRNRGWPIAGSGSPPSTSEARLVCGGLLRSSW